MNTKVVLPVLALTLVVGIGYFGLRNVNAQESKSNLPPMMQGFMERFNLNEDEVAQYMGEQREVRHEEHAAAVEEKLNIAVSEGTLTAEQKNSLLELMDEHKGEMQDMSWEEMHENMGDHKGDMLEWAEENGIDLTQLDLGQKGFGTGDRMYKMHKGF